MNRKSLTFVLTNELETDSELSKDLVELLVEIFPDKNIEHRNKQVASKLVNIVKQHRESIMSFTSKE